MSTDISSNHNAMQLIKCAHTGIAYNIPVEATLGNSSTNDQLVGMEFVLSHPLSHINTVKHNAPMFSAGQVAPTLAAGAVITILRHHNLLVLHEDSEHNLNAIYAANQAFCMGFTKHALNKLAYKLLTNEKSIVQANKKSKECPNGGLSKFDVGAVYASVGEFRQEEQYFVQCFKGWLAGILQPTTEELIKVALNEIALEERRAADSVLDSSKPANVHNVQSMQGLTFEGGYVVDLDDDKLTTISLNLYDEASREARRKSLEQIMTKVKGQIKYSFNLGIVSENQYEILTTSINNHFIKPAVYDAVLALLEKFIIQHSSHVSRDGVDKRKVLVVMQTMAWFKILNAEFAIASLNKDAFTIVVDSVEAEPVVLVKHVGQAESTLVVREASCETKLAKPTMTLAERMAARRASK